MKINSKEEFENLAREVDQKLIEDGVPIQGRQLMAGREFARILNCSLPVAQIFSPPIENVYEGESLAAHIYKWFKTRYGDRLNVDLSPGSIAILLRKDVWKIKFPLVVGRAFITSIRDIDQYQNSPKIDKSGNGVLINIPNYIENLSVDLAKDLKDEELFEINKIFLDGYKMFNLLYKVKNKPFISEAKKDIESAVNFLIEKKPHSGLSKWASLQLSEKLLKCVLTLNGVTIPQSHNLSRLSELVSANSSIDLDESLIESIQCGAGVRYGEENVSLDDAINAHHSSIRIAVPICNNIQ